MVSTSTKHFRTYQPRPFTKEERGDVTILFGGLHWRAERLIQGSLTRLGYKTQILPPATKADLLTGRAVADIGQCCPTSFTTGNLANFLTGEAQKSSPQEVAEKYVYFTAGSCGACRFGQYHQSYELALRNSGMDQPTYSPVQQIVERSGTLFFSFQDLDSTKPTGSVKIRVETISYYLGKYSADIMAKKRAASPPGCPLRIAAPASMISPVSPE